MIQRNGKGYTLICDVCGYDAPKTFPAFRDAVDYKKEHHWRARKFGEDWIDSCPKCKDVVTKDMV